MLSKLDEEQQFAFIKVCDALRGTAADLLANKLKAENNDDDLFTPGTKDIALVAAEKQHQKLATICDKIQWLARTV